MPLYDFRCADGHVTERLAQFSTVSISCGECEKEAVKQAVAAFSRPPRMEGWGSDFHWTKAMRDAHDEAAGRKREVQSIAREYIGNGFGVSQER